jgi:hypothetical protein
VKANNGKKTFKPYFDRLVELKNIFLFQQQRNQLPSNN